ncbi:MAG: leucine--tRNA ligase [Bacteroidia bacterium]|nr:leucine--tRNA ligase [Bacteroidia bacterium]
MQRGRPISELKLPENIAKPGQKEIVKYIDSRRLAYYDDALVWWCPNCRIVCANEEVLNDCSHEKCGNRVEKKNLKQWMLRIPLYAERLLKGIDKLDWPEGIKDMQRNWIGRSTGAEVDFKIEGLNENLTVFTTRPDTLFGATYMVIAPEHPLTDAITTHDNKNSVNDYIKATSLKSDLDRTDLAKEKTGVFTGRYAINPVNKKQIPIWVADYVLTGYGTGAIMAVPAHDNRDFEFAQKFHLPIACIQDPDVSDSEQKKRILEGKECWTEDGKYINSSNKSTGIDINGMNKDAGIAHITKWLETKNLGTAKVNYKLRDWLFSRQRYWGEPFPVIHWEDGEITAMNENELPLELPKLEKYLPGESGESPLSNSTEWLNIADKNGRKGRRETNTMPQWAGSCWYYLRFIDPKNDKMIFDLAKEKYWMPVDLYIGGAEHAVLHLLYSRFWHKVLFDLGIVSTDEPYQRLFNQGMILAFAYETESGSRVSGDLVEEREGKYFHKETGDEMKQIVAKMSKSLKNVVNPDDVTSKYGADSLRLYEMFMGPLDVTKPWDDKGVKGVFGFLGRAFRFLSNPDNITNGEEDGTVLKGLHQVIKKVEGDIENLRFNTAISAMMIFLNLATKKGKVTVDTACIFTKVLAPFAPHMAEELWHLLGHNETLSYEPWPEFNEEFLKEDIFDYPVSFDGKMRFKIELPVNLSKEEIIKIVLADERAKKWIGTATPSNIIVVPNRIVNIVIKN